MGVPCPEWVDRTGCRSEASFVPLVLISQVHGVPWSNLLGPLARAMGPSIQSSGTLGLQPFVQGLLGVSACSSKNLCSFYLFRIRIFFWPRHFWCCGFFHFCFGGPVKWPICSNERFALNSGQLSAGDLTDLFRSAGSGEGINMFSYFEW